MKKTLLFILILFLSVELINAQNGGYALKFDGTDDYISVPDNTSLDFTQFTIEMWVYRNSSGNCKLIGQTNAGNAQQGFIFGVRDNKLKLETWHGSYPYTNIESTETVPVNEWVHLTMIWKTGDRLKGYINGKQVIDAATFNADITNTTPMIIGKAPWYNISEDHFNGYMDEIRIWNDVRTQDEIKANMYKELNGNEANLVAYYKMSNSSGTTLSDNQSSGTNNGTINGALWKASGAFAGSRHALDFDGTDDYISFSTSSPTFNNSAMTLEAWIKTSSTNTEEIINWGSTQSGTPDVVEFRVDNGLLQFGIDEQNEPGTGFLALSSVTAVNSGKWTHVAVVKNSTSVSLYINGKLDVTGTIERDPSVAQMAIANLFQEGSYKTTGYNFPGNIDEVRIWNSVRTASQIRENMMKTLSGNESGLVAYYRFDQTDGATLYDITGNGNNGTLTNMDAATDWVSSSAFNTWIGSESSDWATAENWSAGVPSTTDNVGIYQWDLGNEATISGTPTVNHLFLSSTASPTLSSNLTVDGSLLLEKNLDLNAQTITLGSSGYLSESSYRLYGTSGTLTATRTLGTVSSKNIAGLGFEMTSSSDLGNTTIARGVAAQTDGGLNNGLSRYYDVTVSGGTPVNIVFNYNDSEVGGDENNLALYKSEDGGNSWTKQTGAILNTTDNTMSINNVGSFSRFTAADSDSPLPIELTSFTASAADNSITLNWHTTTEVNNYGFEIERLQDYKIERLQEWEAIGFVEGSGNSNSTKEYSFTDNLALTHNLALHYRLKQIDTDGLFTYSKEVEVNIENIPTEFALEQNYPNPFNPSTKISFALPSDGAVQLKIFNLLGQEIASLINEEKKAGNYTIDWNASNISTGVYIYQLNWKNQKLVKKMSLIK